MSEVHPADDSRRAEAERLFSRHLQDLEEGRDADFEALCRERPELGAELRDLHEDWETVRGVVADLRRHFADDVDLGVSVDSRADLDSSSAAQTLARLGSRGPGRERYTLHGEIARGGMGAVFRVWDEDLGRPLAMKLILEERGGGTPRSSDPSTLARFLSEAQITGQLEHPGIVPVHELGVDAKGRLFFTMRLVQGQDLGQVLRLVQQQREDWTVTRAVGVLWKACEAVAYAHSKGVIHRDLKPANIMVGHFGETYVMDWGLAKVLGPTPTAEAGRRAAIEGAEPAGDAGEEMLTRDGTVLGTPAYMPPEQAAGRVAELGKSADVYSLGSILYELLTGRRPYEESEGRPSRTDALERLLAGPPAPVRELNPAITEELVAICEKAMARHPEARYADTQELAEDLRAFLEGRVVRAYETGALAELRKWVIRNRVAAASLAAGLLLAVAGLGTAFQVQARARRTVETKNQELVAANLAIQQERDRADDNAHAARREAETTGQVLDFVTEMFHQNDPRQARGESVTVKEVLDRARHQVEIGLVMEPRVRAPLLSTMGTVYLHLGLFPPAEELLQAASSDLREELGEHAAESLRVQLDLGEVLRLQSRIAEAEQTFQEILVRLAERDPDADLEALARAGIGAVRYDQGRYQEALVHLEHAAESMQALWGAGHPRALRVSQSLADCLLQLREYRRADLLLRSLWEQYRGTLGEDHPDALHARTKLARLCAAQGRFEEAEEHFVEALAASRRVNGGKHLDTITLLNGLGTVYLDCFRFAEAAVLLEEACESSEATLGEEHPVTQTSLVNLGLVRRRLGQHDEAEALLLRSVALGRRTAGADHPETLTALANLGGLHLERRRFDEAESVFEEALDRARSAPGENVSTLVYVLGELGRLCALQAREDEAEEYYEEAVELGEARLGELHFLTLSYELCFGDLCRQQDRLEEAQTLLEVALEGFRQTLGPDHAYFITALQGLVLVYRDLGHLTEAERGARELLALTPPSSPLLRRSRQELLDAIVAEQDG